MWLLLLSKIRILRSQKHQLLRFYRVSPLSRQEFKRDNQMYISSQVKSALRKFSEGKDHDCNSFMPDLSVCTSLVFHIWPGGLLYLLNIKCFD